MECLFRYYSYGLEKKFRPDIFKDFQEETMKDYEAGELISVHRSEQTKWVLHETSRLVMFPYHKLIHEFIC